MTEQEWNQLEELLANARAGDDQAFTAACEIIDQKLKRQVKAIVRQTGVRPEESAHDAWQEAMLAFVKHYQQVETIRHLPYWLAITGLRAAWKDRWPRYSKKKKPGQAVEQRHQAPGPIGTKPMTIAGREYQVKIYAPGGPTAAPSEPRPRLEPLTESIIEKYRVTVPDQVGRIHNQRVLSEVEKTLRQLPPRWRRAIELVCEESRTEAAQALGCGRKRYDKLLKKARKRLRLLLPGYVLHQKAKGKSSSAKAKLRPEHLCEENLKDESDASVGSDKAAAVGQDAWWPLVIDSLRRHINLTADKEHLFFLLTADLGGNAPEDHGSGALDDF